MDEEELISVIIPAYNVDSYIEECIASVQRQTYNKLDIIIIDDGSGDRTGEIVRRLSERDSRIRYYYQDNAGVVSARNLGIEKARGQYIGFVDGDDYIEPNMYEKLYQSIVGCDMASCGVLRQMSENRAVRAADQFEGRYERETNMNQLYSRMFYDLHKGELYPMTPWLVNKLFRKDMIEPFYREIDTELKYAEDLVFLYHYIFECRAVCFISDCLYCYRYRRESACHSCNELILTNINKVYAILKHKFENAFEYGSGEFQMSLQLQRGITELLCNAVNRFMGFDRSVRILKFVIDVSPFKGKKVILYGAGQMGQDVYLLLKRQSIEVVLWIDKDAAYCQAQGLQVEGPRLMTGQAFDTVLIAIQNERIAEEVKEELCEIGFDRNRIIWRQPLRAY